MLKSNKKFLIPLVTVFSLLSLSEAEAAKLKKSDYKKHSDSKSVVLLEVSWARKWNCAGYENAQLTKLLFENISSGNAADKDYEEIRLKTTSRLFANPDFKIYGFLVNPGTYAFTGWSIRASRSMTEGGTISATRDHLVDGSDYHGGTFEVTAGEVIFIGNFFIDCLVSPIPWRFFPVGEEFVNEQFDTYKSKFKFIDNKTIIFRLLETQNFGSDPLLWLIGEANSAFYSGYKDEAIELFLDALEKAKKSNNKETTSIAMYGLGRAHGHSCNFNEAVIWLENSTVARADLPNRSGSSVSQNYLELARLYSSVNDWKNTVVNYGKGLPLLETLDMPSSDPIGYADVLESYLVALQKVGETEKAAEVELTINELRRANPGKSAVFVEKPYPNNCNVPESK
ncbi:MAG: tetratricopeptide (TPR) repeat protein [Gammaproteobacteria bacterium]|jgi:tetratricopeptide (TPR) repeat protein